MLCYDSKPEHFSAVVRELIKNPLLQQYDLDSLPDNIKISAVAALYEHMSLKLCEKHNILHYRSLCPYGNHVTTITQTYFDFLNMLI